jgi:dinuclear metal center YbgI/SA1388 family protein
MSIKCKDIVDLLEEIAPSSLAEEWDNTGLLLGSLQADIRKVMVCLDVTSEIVDKAVEKNIDMIVSHHPIIFKGLKKINQDEYKGNIIYKLIKNEISVLCAHTNLDLADGGVNVCLAEILELNEVENLKQHRTEQLYKIVVFVPEDSIDIVRDAMSATGAGWIGNYSDCSFMTKGTGTFRPLKNSNPYIGSQGKLEKVMEYRLETVVPRKNLNKVISSMISAHPYEEVAYDVYRLELSDSRYGFGKVGNLEKPLSLESFIRLVKEKLGIRHLKVVGEAKDAIKRVAVFSGSFDGDIKSVLAHKADVLVAGDIKYHTAVEALENGLCIIDAGHFETERIIVPKIVEIIKDRFPKLDVIADNEVISPFRCC